MKVAIVLLVLFFVKISNGIYLNPYSYGSYDPAAESPELYNYYARYYNPNRHNPYAPYPTYMKPGVFRLPRMYQIDPAWAPYYPPNRFETLPLAQGNSYYSKSRALGVESVAVFPDGCGGNGNGGGSGGGTGSGGNIKEPKSETELLLEDLDRGGNGGYIGRSRQSQADAIQGQIERPQWSATQPTAEELAGFGQRATLIRPRVYHPPSSSVGYSNDPRSSPQFEAGAGGAGGCMPCGERATPSPYQGTGGPAGCVPCGGSDGGYGESGINDQSTGVASDFERLPIDRVSSSSDSNSDSFPNPSSNPNRFKHRRYISL